MELKHNIDVDPEAILEEWKPEPGSRLFEAVERLKSLDDDLHKHETQQAELSRKLSVARDLIGKLDPFTAEPDNVAHLLSQKSAIELLLERIRPRTESLLSFFDMAVDSVRGYDRFLRNIRIELLRERNRINGFLKARDWQKQGMGEKLLDGSFPNTLRMANKKASGYIGRDLFTFEEMFPEEDEEAELTAA